MIQTDATASSVPTSETGDEHPRPSEGLRARKIAQAKRAVERAAFEIALERGYEHATVESICEAADISPRTFFNYFGSKEGVFVPSTPAAPDDAEKERFIAGTGSLVCDLIAAITNTMVDEELDPQIFEMRKRLAKNSPEFAKAMLSGMNSVEEAHVALIRERFRAQHRRGTEAELDDEARMVFALAMGAMHFVARRWFEGNFEQTPQALLRDATRLVRRVTAY